MRFTATFVAAALLLALSTPVLSQTVEPVCNDCGGDASYGAVSTVIREEASIDVHFSRTVLASGYHKCLESEAHAMYEQALNIYHEVNRLMLHTLCKEGAVREERLIEIALKIQRGENILLAAGLINEKDGKWLRRHWVRHEIKHLKDKFALARIRATHLPNLAFAEHVYHFVVDEVKATIVIVASIPGLVIHGIKEAAHAVHSILHKIKVKIGWAIHEIEEEIIYIGHKIHEAGHKLKVKIHEEWDELKEKLHHHHCHDDDSCKPCHHNDHSCPSDGAVIVAEEVDVDVHFKWTREQAHTEVRRCVEELKTESESLEADLKITERQVLAANWE